MSSASDSRQGAVAVVSFGAPPVNSLGHATRLAALVLFAASRTVTADIRNRNSQQL